MTKLEELKADWDATLEAVDVAWEAAWEVADAARDAYLTELKKLNTAKLDELKAALGAAIGVYDHNAIDAALAAYTAEVRRQEHQEKSHAR
jgi:hypothetical protein